MYSNRIVEINRHTGILEGTRSFPATRLRLLALGIAPKEVTSAVQGLKEFGIYTATHAWFYFEDRYLEIQKERGKQ